MRSLLPAKPADRPPRPTRPWLTTAPSTRSTVVKRSVPVLADYFADLLRVRRNTVDNSKPPTTASSQVAGSGTGAAASVQLPPAARSV